jgi:hypothetical protein
MAEKLKARKAHLEQEFFNLVNEIIPERILWLDKRLETLPGPPFDDFLPSQKAQQLVAEYDLAIGLFQTTLTDMDIFLTVYGRCSDVRIDATIRKQLTWCCQVSMTVLAHTEKCAEDARNGAGLHPSFTAAVIQARTNRFISRLCANLRSLPHAYAQLYDLITKNMDEIQTSCQEKTI